MARSKLLNAVEYALARLAVGAVDAIPTRVSLAIARGLGDAGFLLLAGRRKTAVANLLRTGIVTGRKDALRIARASFRHFAMLTVEALVASRTITPENLADHAEIVLPEATAKLLDDPGQGILLVTGHLGNWEVVGHIISFRKPLVAVARRMDNPWVNRFMERRNSRRNIAIVAKHSQDRHSLVRALRSGHSLGLIMDQHAASHAEEIPFFGIPAKTVSSPARLHLATRCPIVCGYGVRTAPMRFKLVYSEPLTFDLTGDRDHDVRTILTELNRRLEEYIRLHPEQYLWSHRRWRTPRTAGR